MNFAALFTLAPWGATVAYSDGKPKPPARFTKKVREWERRNGSGIFIARRASEGKHEWDKDAITLRASESPGLIVNMTFGPGTADYTVTPAAPGTIIAFQTYHDKPNGDAEAAYVWATEEHLRAWKQRTGYQLGRQSWRMATITADGSVIPWETPDLALAA